MDSANGVFKNIPFILASVSLNAAAQLFLKRGMISIGSFSFELRSIVDKLLPVAMNLYVLGGMACYALSIGLWLLVLSRTEVSVAYPFLSIGYVIVAVLGYLLFHDAMTVQRMAGIGLICLGVILVSRT